MRAGFVVALLLLAAGCSDDVQCIEVELECDRLYEPTFDNVFSMTLNDKCVNGPCHNAATARAGLIYEDPDQAYDLLVNGGRVEPGNAGCSLLILRVESSSGGFVMPPGNPLSEQERCSIRQWVENGAQR